MSREQLGLFAPSPFSPVWPKLSSPEGELLHLMLSGEKLTTSSDSMMANWQLSDYIFNLIYKGWPIVEKKLPSKQPYPVMQYHLPDWVLAEIGVNHGD